MKWNEDCFETYVSKNESQNNSYRNILGLCEWVPDFLIPQVVHHRPEIFKGQLDFGTMGVEEKRNMTFTLRNDNPTDVRQHRSRWYHKKETVM